MGFGSKGAHVGIPTESILTGFFSGLQHGGGVGVLQQNVCARVDQGLSGLRLFGGIKPGVDPNDFGFDLGVDALRAEREGIDVAQHFRNREGAHEAERAGFAHLASDHACQIGVLVEASVIDAHVVGGFVAGGMLEFHIGEVFGDFEHRLHVAKAGGENDLVALRGQIANHALGVCAFGHFFDEGGFHLVAKLGFNGFAAEIMREGPACIANRADIDPSRLQRLSFRCGRSSGWSRCGRGFFLFAAAHQGHGGHGSADSRQFERRALGKVSHLRFLL